MGRIKFLYEARGVAFSLPQFRGNSEKDAIMTRELNELVELGSVSTDTAGNIGLGTEPNGKFQVAGLSAD